ncbi:CsbD family protein [Streptomyces sp. NBC_00879]|uniref:CsbD family protein n=1 Tax=Streptomyces sp. NBC_00879 TaxID=2975855 RepID=UPI00386D13EF|nr:CsbD family protein [Streptomyces sp. NBC_00879]
MVEPRITDDVCDGRESLEFRQFTGVFVNDVCRARIEVSAQSNGKGRYSFRELIRVAEGKRIRGRAQEAVGKAKQKIGRATGRDDLRAKGTGDRAEGKARHTVGEMTDKIKGAAEEVKGKMRRHK